MSCHECKNIIEQKDLYKWLSCSWSIHGGRKSPDLPENYFFFHKKCFPVYDKKRISFLREQDELMNDCKYFVRYGNNMEGWYSREGKSCWVSAYWSEDEIAYKALLGDEKEKLEEFHNFLEENDWLNNWYEPREKQKQYLLETFPPKNRWWFSKQWYD